MSTGLQAPSADRTGNLTEKTVAADAPGQEKTQDQAAEKKKKHRRRMRALRSFLFKTIALVLVVYVLFFHVVGITLMPTRDMYPRLDAGDLLLFYRLEKNPKAQDIVVFEKALKSGENTRRYACRVIAAPGDTVEITDEHGLKVNGNMLIESNIFYSTRPYEEGVTVYPVKLEEGEYFVLADQRNGGVDSRYFGVVTMDEIRGIVITVLRRNNL